MLAMWYYISNVSNASNVRNVSNVERIKFFGKPKNL